VGSQKERAPKSEQNWVLFHETGFQFRGFVISYSDKAFFFIESKPSHQNKDTKLKRVSPPVMDSLVQNWG